MAHPSKRHRPAGSAAAARTASSRPPGGSAVGAADRSLPRHLYGAEALRRALLDAFADAGAGAGIWRIVLYGSRASGRSRAGSDVDLAVFVEPPPDVSWGAREIVAARERLRPLAAAAVAAALGPGVPVDLAVRTLDHDAEARAVLGGVEHWAATTGVVLYERAPDRPPVVRRPPAQVARDHTCAWVAYAARTLWCAEAAHARAGGHATAGVPSGVQASVVLAVRRACLAVCTHRQVPSDGADGWPTAKRAPISATVARMGAAAPALAAEITRTLVATVPSPGAGRPALPAAKAAPSRAAVASAQRDNAERESVSRGAEAGRAVGLRRGEAGVGGRARPM